MQKKIGMAVLLLSMIGFMPNAAFAYELKTGQSIIIPESQSLSDTLYAAGQSITINADVAGDVVCAGQSVIINGNVGGSVMCVGQSVTINGNVSGSVRAAGGNIQIGGDVGQNVMAFGATIEQTMGKNIGWDMLIGAGNATVLGNIGKDLHGGAGQVTIAGEVGRNVDLAISDQEGKHTQSGGLNIVDGARIGGNVRYTATKDVQIASGATVLGQISKILPTYAEQKNKFGEKVIEGMVLFEIISLIGALIVASLFMYLSKKNIRNITDGMLQQASITMGWGLVTTLLSPILAIILLVTIIGIPLAIIGLSLWLIAMYMAKLLTAILIGRMVLNKKGVKQEKSMYVSAAVGILISWIIFAIPLLGGLLSFLAILWGMGGIWIYLRRGYSTDQVTTV